MINCIKSSLKEYIYIFNLDYIFYVRIIIYTILNINYPKYRDIGHVKSHSLAVHTWVNYSPSIYTI